MNNYLALDKIFQKQKIDIISRNDYFISSMKNPTHFRLRDTNGNLKIELYTEKQKQVVEVLNFWANEIGGRLVLKEGNNIYDVDIAADSPELLQIVRILNLYSKRHLIRNEIYIAHIAKERGELIVNKEFEVIDVVDYELLYIKQYVPIYESNLYMVTSAYVDRDRRVTFDRSVAFLDNFSVNSLHEDSIRKVLSNRKGISKTIPSHFLEIKRIVKDTLSIEEVKDNFSKKELRKISKLLNIPVS